MLKGAIIEIRPASFDQIAAARGGQMIEVSEDVQGVANDLAEIDPHIRLRFSERGGYFVIYYLPDDSQEGDGYLIFTAQELDQRIVHHMRDVHHRCMAPGYSFADDLEAQEAKAKAAQDQQRSEEMGEMHERLAHALREQAGYDKQRIFVPEGV